MPIWSILALSGTLAGEASRGSLDLLATAGLSRRRLVLEKLAAHLAAVVLAMAVLVLVLVFTGVQFGTLPGDEIQASAAIGYAALTGLAILIPGSIAFAAAQFVGRGAAAGLAGAVLVAAYFVHVFRAAVPVFESLAPLSWFSWTANHVPLARLEDWPSLLGPAALVALLLVAGVVGFERRDVGITIHVPTPHLPRPLVGLGGPLGRSFGERLPTALAWGIGLAAYVVILTVSIPSLEVVFRDTPAIERMIRLVYPDVDLTSVGGMLQLVFVEFGMIVVGIAAATIAGGWASDESAGRLEVLLSTPLSRAAWLVRSGLGAFLAIVLLVAVVAAGTGLGALSQGSEVVTAVAGTFVLALYGLAWAGAGIAVGGLVRASLAPAVVLALTIGTFLDTIFAIPLKLPDWVAGLALTSHYGRPLVGTWDLSGIAASLVLAFGGLAVGAWGLSRRDVRG
jgi:ABC-2 type transport system permease protein